jgi:hypothetical protein
LGGNFSNSAFLSEADEVLGGTRNTQNQIVGFLHDGLTMKDLNQLVYPLPERLQWGFALFDNGSILAQTVSNSLVLFTPVSAGETVAGSNVSVAVGATLPDGSTAPLAITFENVTSSGQTSVTTSSQGPPPPTGFKLGAPPVYYDVITTAAFTGTINLCFSWAEGQFHNESAIRLQHFEANAWHDVTSSLDTTNNKVCGTVTSLSPFALMETAYQFAGFFAPVDNLPTVNGAKAGSAIPVKFSLGGNYGLNITDPGYPRSQQINCDSSAPTDTLEETVTAGGSSLSYDSATGRYNYVWKSDKGWAGTCRQLILSLNDGTVHKASFKFTK